jgi:hypothetical protein
VVTITATRPGTNLYVSSQRQHASSTVRKRGRRTWPFHTAVERCGTAAARIINWYADAEPRRAEIHAVEILQGDRWRSLLCDDQFAGSDISASIWITAVTDEQRCDGGSQGQQ